MDIRNCRSCGKLFNYIGGGIFICPTCSKELEDKFIEVKAYIREHKQASLAEISDDNGVSIGQLRKWVREERLVFTEDSVIGIECENCGAMIRTGRFCHNCKDHMANNLNSMYKKEPEKEPENPFTKTSDTKMRFFGRDQK